MDEQSVRPEDLPALDLRPLRELVLEGESVDGHPPHVASASGIVRRGVFAYVIGDDQHDMAIFDLSTDAPGKRRRAIEGDLPSGEEERHEKKPDLEALTTVPPFDEAPYGGLLGLGSGSNEHRDRGFFWPLNSDGSVRGDPHPLDLSPLYGRLRKELGAINIEGACVFGNSFWLFHRGNKGDAPNTVAEIGLSALEETLGGDLEVDPEELSDLRSYDLGQVDGIDLCFSDATPVSEELVVFTASAEGDEGEIRGSVVGTIDAKGKPHRLRTIDSKWKVEGVHATIDNGIIDFVFVCDQDDPESPSPLLTATMPIEAKFEQSS